MPKRMGWDAKYRKKQPKMHSPRETTHNPTSSPPDDPNPADLIHLAAKIAAALAAGAPIAAPVYQGVRGHPVGISSAFRQQLEALSGDEGARSVLRNNAHMIELIEVDDPGVCRDIDTPADLSESSRLR